MPLYDYTCPNGHTFEAVFRISEDSSTAKCPECGEAAEKQAAAPGIKFKGKGWTPKHYPGK
jgi:putative FmdB family regulatory protein